MGTTRNKNLKRVARACADLDREVRLWILGELSPKQEQFLDSLDLEWENFAGLPWHQVVDVYERCTAVLFASTYEGFGLPILEGQAVGRPVITSDRSPMREVAGGGAMLVDPEDVESIREGIDRILEDRDLREQLVGKGFENVELYRPEAIASQYADLYSSLVPGR